MNHQYQSLSQVSKQNQAKVARTQAMSSWSSFSHDAIAITPTIEYRAFAIVSGLVET